MSNPIEIEIVNPNVPTHNLQTKIITPSKEIQVITADEGYYGLEEVIVSATPFNNDDVVEEINDVKVMLTDGANATPSDIKLGKTAYVGGKLIEGNFEISGTLNITDTEIKDVTNYKYAQIVDDNLNAENIVSGKTILGIEGTFSQDGTATPEDIKLGKTAYVKGEKLVGTYTPGTTLKELLTYTKKCDYLFAFSDITELTGHINYEDTSNVESMYYMFGYSRKLKEVPSFDSSKVNKMKYMFMSCESLTTISGLNMVSVVEVANNDQVENMFYECFNLRYLTLLNIKISLQVGSGSRWGHLLTLESLINTCQECVNVGKSRTLTVGSANMTKLANVYVKLTGEAEEDESLPKLPMVQCESTHEGAMSISEYMNLKNWALA